MENAPHMLIAPEPTTVAPVARRMLRTRDFEQTASEDLAGMFGRWKEADHCDKD